ncbi:MAG: PepSY domain-containing protein [Chloroflexota bacterium]
MKRSDWIIAGFLAVLFLMVLGGGMIFWLQAQAYQSTASTSPVGPSVSNSSQLAEDTTAGSALNLSHVSAQQLWQADALPVSASATIVRFETVEDLYTGRASWAAVFFSPIASSIATYTVVDGKVSLLSSKVVEEAPLTFDTVDMRLDSGQAMTVALASGGEELFEGEAQRVATLKVEINSETGRLEWQIAIQNETSGAYKFFRIDAVTGEVLVIS